MLSVVWSQIGPKDILRRFKKCDAYFSSNVAKHHLSSRNDPLWNVPPFKFYSKLHLTTINYNSRFILV